MELTTIEKLLIIRRRRNLTVAKAARRWRVGVHSLYKWENGLRFPSAETERRLKKIIQDEERKGW